MAVSKRQWQAAAHCIAGILANFAVIGFGLAAFEQKIWPAFWLAAGVAAAAIYISWRIPDDQLPAFSGSGSSRRFWGLCGLQGGEVRKGK